MMRVCFTGLVSAVVTVSASSPPVAYGQKKDGGVVVGKIWQLRIKQNGEVKDSLDLRVRGYEMFGPAGKLLGTYKILEPDHMKLTFREGKFAGYEADMRLTKREPPTWFGFATKEGAEKYGFQLVFKLD